MKAFANVEKQTPNIKLLIVGNGETLPEIKRIAEDLHIKDKVIFTGNVPHLQIYNYIPIMDIAVMAKSKWYMSPIKIFEYGALGKAVIAVATLPVRDVMKNEADGILIKETIDDLEDALRKLVNNKALRERLGDNFREKIKSQFTWDIAASTILKQFSAINSKKG